MKPEQPPITGKEDKQDLANPLKALSEFYDAFNSRDLGKVEKNWAQTDEVIMYNPVGGIKRGWEEIRTVYERIFSGPAKVYVEFYDYTIYEGRELFYAVGRERGEFRIGETTVKLALRTSRIYRWIDSQWRQVHHHGSIDEPELLARYQKAVEESL
jgi:limonene-1,2-epoxide hydrolase